MTALPLDQDARDRALNPRESFHLEAPAGSGKTSVLLARFLTLLAQVDAPEELLALTFTRKAAGELRARVMQLLRPEAELKSDASPMDRLLADLAQKVFQHFDRKGLPLQEVLAPERLPILTFHGFCARLLPLAPQEAGVPLEFRLVEEQDAEWVKQEALEELRRRLAARDSGDPVRQALVNRLVRLNNNWRRLAGELRMLLDRRDTLQDFLALAQESRDLDAYKTLMTGRLATVLAPDLKLLSRELAGSFLGQHWPKIVAALQAKGHPDAVSLLPLPPQARLEDLGQWQALAQVLLTAKGEVRKQFPLSKGFSAGFAGSLEELPGDFFNRLARYRDLPPEILYTEEVAALHDLILLLSEALAVYTETCRQRGLLDFIDLEMAALKLLAQAPSRDIFMFLGWGIKHLLVDEFQDTSENQKTLLCRLLSGWEAEPGRTLTVVGDPKQSIYGWRKAKLNLFLESRHGLHCDSGAAFPLTPLCLTTNFRASRTLITWVNRVFANVMEFGRDPDRLAFQAAVPAPAASKGDSPRLALFVNGDKNAGREAEAHWLTHRLTQVLAERDADETVGVLLFARTHLKVYLKILQEAGLSVRVREGLKLMDSRVVEHLHNLARALARPHDDTAWAALLAGPWGPQPLAIIAQVAQMPGTLWEQKLAWFAQEGLCPPDLHHVLTALLQSRRQAGRTSLHDTLREFLDATRAWEGIAAWEGAPGVANARTYLELLAQAESGLPEATFLKADFNLAEAYQPPDPRAQDSPVELMTVHGAKGLEFDRVFLPFLDWQPLRMGGNTPPPFLLEEIPDTASYGLALAPPYWQSKPSLLYRGLREVQHNRLLAEARRVFYVAATRAKKHLLLSGVCPSNETGQPKPPPDSPLAWLLQHYQPEGLFYGESSILPDPELHVELWQDFPAAAQQPARPVKIPPILSFTPEPPPYAFVYPSQLIQEVEPPDKPTLALETIPAPLEAAGTTASEDVFPRLRGEVIHRLLETASFGDPLPEASGVAAALRQGGLDPERAAAAAPEILAEAADCLADPFLARLLSPDLPEAKSEWLLEDAPADGLIRRGQIDRLVYDGQDWWLVDYKTSRPSDGGDWESFTAGEVEKYRPQLLAYRDMIAKARGLAPETIKAVIYFTAHRQAVNV
jgi:ATP-dependent helicase/nuclease subunit A